MPEQAALSVCEQTQVVVPGWLRLPIALQAGAPQTYARFADRWG